MTSDKTITLNAELGAHSGYTIEASEITGRGCSAINLYLNNIDKE